MADAKTIANNLSDVHQRESKRPVDPKLVRELSKLNPLRSLGQIALEYVMVAGAIVLCERYFSWPLYALTVMFIGARMHAFFVLLHEGTHRRLAKNRKVNDVVADVFLAWPLLLSLIADRLNHFSHHRYLNTEKDPDWVFFRSAGNDAFPMSRSKLAVTLLKDMAGLEVLTVLRDIKRRREVLETATGVTKSKADLMSWLNKLYYLSFFGALTVFGGWKLFAMYWLVPGFTWFQFIVRLRVMGDHFALPYDHEYRSSRTTLVTLFERWFVMPHNINYHTDHHLYPSVPFYNLPRLHAALMESEHYRENAHITRTFLMPGGFLSECVRPALPRADAAPDTRA